VDTLKTSSPIAAQEFWDRFIDSIHNQGIKSPFDRWHVLHAERYIKAHPDKRLSQHTPDEISEYLENQGRNARRRDWQFHQIVDAIRTLFTIIFLFTPAFIHACLTALCCILMKRRVKITYMLKTNSFIKATGSKIVCFYYYRLNTRVLALCCKFR